MATLTGAAPLTPITRHVVPSVTIAADTETPVYVNDALGGVVTVTGVKYYGSAAKSGANTNTRTLGLYNRGSDGNGTVLVAVLALVSGVNLVAFVGKTIVLSATAANLDLAANDVLTWQSLHVANGITDPGGLVEITVSRA